MFLGTSVCGEDFETMMTFQAGPASQITRTLLQTFGRPRWPKDSTIRGKSILAHGLAFQIFKIHWIPQGKVHSDIYFVFFWSVLSPLLSIVTATSFDRAFWWVILEVFDSMVQEPARWTHLKANPEAGVMVLLFIASNVKSKVLISIPSINIHYTSGCSPNISTIIH